MQLNLDQVTFKEKINILRFTCGRKVENDQHPVGSQWCAVRMPVRRTHASNHTVVNPGCCVIHFRGNKMVGKIGNIFSQI